MNASVQHSAGGDGLCDALTLFCCAERWFGFCGWWVESQVMADHKDSKHAPVPAAAASDDKSSSAASDTKTASTDTAAGGSGGAAAASTATAATAAAPKRSFLITADSEVFLTIPGPKGRKLEMAMDTGGLLGMCFAPVPPPLPFPHLPA